MKVRKSSHEYLKMLKQLNKKLKNLSGNCRGKKAGDMGKMVALGRKGMNDECSSAKNDINLQHLLKQVATEGKKFHEMTFPEEHELMMHAEKTN